MLALNRPLLNMEILINVLKVLASILSTTYLQPPYNPLIEDYTRIFYMTDTEDIPSTQCKMSLRGPKSMRKVDCLSLAFIDFYIPADDWSVLAV
jgi:hypothetical protein